MKSLSLLLGLVLTNAAFAASPFLPISATNTFRSGERALVEAAVAQAEAEGKFVLVDMAAAWCGFCYALEVGEENMKTEMAPTLAHFVSVTLDEMFTETIVGTDFLAAEVPWYPALYIYNPANKKWTQIYAGDAPSLKATLDDYLAHPDLSGYYVQLLMTAIKTGTAKTSTDDVMNALVPLAFEGSAADILSATTGVIKAMKAQPKQFDVTVEKMETKLNDVYLRAIEMGKLTVAKIQAADPDALKDAASNPTLLGRILFNVPIGSLIRTQGNKAASDQCAAISAVAAKALENQKTSVQRKAQLTRDLECLSLKVQLKEKAGTDVLAYEASMSTDERSTFIYSLTKSFALTGTNFDKAISYGKLWKAAYEEGLKDTPELLARVKVSTDARLAAYAAGKTHP